MKPVSKARNYYLASVSLLGLVLLFWAALQISDYERLDRFILLLLLAVAAQSTITFTVLGAYLSVGSAISFSTLPFYGVAAAVIIAAVSEISPWFIGIYQKPTTRQRALERLGFNIGMNAASMFVAGRVFLLLTAWLGQNSIPGRVFPWLLAALVSDQVNLWLLFGILYLANGVKPGAAWREHRWAIPINILVTGVGGALLAVAVEQFDVLGIAIFFLPILLSSYAFRLYVNRTKEQMNHLEEMVEARTHDLAKANQALAELNREKDAFLAVLTHDMRSPLTSIYGYACLLRDRPDLTTDERHRMVEIILRNERELLEIVNNILDIEQMQSGMPVQLERENFELNLLIDEVVEGLAAQAREKYIDLIYQQEPEPIYIHADRRKVRRIVQNLVSNAVKYTPPRGNVLVMAQMNDRFVYLSVRDSGYGIPAEELPYIFDRFRRVAKHKGKAAGSGLGLAIVKSLVEAHDGSVTVTSVEGKGSQFQIKLPA